MRSLVNSVAVVVEYLGREDVKDFIFTIHHTTIASRGIALLVFAALVLQGSILTAILITIVTLIITLVALIGWPGHVPSVYAPYLMMQQHATCLNEDRHGMGYWEGAVDLASANVRLAEKAAETATISSSDKILDVGIGFVNNIEPWLRYEPESIEGFGISLSEVEDARERYRRSPNVAATCGNVCSMPYGDEAFDVVMCIESAFQCGSREKFIKEAYRVLKPGGRLVITDLVATAGKAVNGVADLFWQAVVCMPDCNHITAEEWSRQAEGVGFETRNEIITDKTLTPYIIDYSAALVKSRMPFSDGPPLCANYASYALATSLEMHRPFDYLLGVCVKPNHMESKAS